MEKETPFVVSGEMFFSFAQFKEVMARRRRVFPKLILCDICGDCHETDNIPLSCQTGDGE